MKNCPNLQKSLDWCEGAPQYPGVRRRLYYINKNLIEIWPTLDRDDFGRIIDAHYIGEFVIAADAAWQYIDINIDKSTVTSEPQGEVPSQTQLNKATFVHNGIDAEATAAAGYLNNADCVFVYEDMIGHFRVLGNNKWRTKITVNQDQGQGTNPASTTITVEVTDMIAPPFYTEGLETEDGEVRPSYDDDASLVPRLTSPSGSTFNIGTIADSGTSVTKTMRIKGANLAEDLTLTVTGTGLSVSKSSITAEEANEGIDITLTYTNSASGAGSLNGSLNIASQSEVNKTITVTAKKAALTSPSDATISVGTIASDGSSVQKSITVQGANLTKSVSLSVTGTGFSLNRSSLSASQVNNGAAVLITYSNAAQGPANATGSLIITSDEVSKTISLTAAKAAPDVQPTDEKSTPVGLIGFVIDTAQNVNGFFSGKDITEYPSSAKRQTIVVPVSNKFPAIPANQRHYQDTSTDSYLSPEGDFVLNTVFEEYAPLEAKGVKGFLIRHFNGRRFTNNSPFLLNPQKKGAGSNNYKETSLATSWRGTPNSELINIDELSGYDEDNVYYLCNNIKLNRGSDMDMTAPVVYGEDFDALILPKTWKVQDVFQANYQQLFPGESNYAAGMVMYGNYIIQFFTTGKIVVIDKTTHSVIASGTMAMATSTMHCNAVSLGPTVPDGSLVPYLYISQWTAGECICHVHKITWQNGVATTVVAQTIEYSGSKFKTGTNYSHWDWTVDAKTGYIWAVGYAANATNRYGSKAILSFVLPEIPAQPNGVRFTDDDIDYDWGFNFAGAQQDIHIENNLMFWAFSYDNANGTGGVLMIDLMDESLLSDYIIDLQSTGREVEGIFRDGSLLYVTSHQGGNNNFNLKMHVVDLLQTNLDEE